MKILNAFGVATLLFVALMLSSTESFSQEEAACPKEEPSEECNRGPNHTIQVRVDDDGNAELKYRGGSGEKVCVCEGDNVRWVMIGSNRGFAVDFKYANGAPFEPPKRRESKDYEIDVDITGEKETYDYDVEIADAERMDPQIIVE